MSPEESTAYGTAGFLCRYKKYGGRFTEGPGPGIMGLAFIGAALRNPYQV